jgi:peroxin-3
MSSKPCLSSVRVLYSYDLPAFTRTLTVLYSTTLLTLFTHIQLSLLNRIKYVQSVRQLEREEREREPYTPSRFMSASLMQWLSEDFAFQHLGEAIFQDLSPESEMKYLTMSWWLLHVGWKDVGERVRRAVEEVFNE